MIPSIMCKIPTEGFQVPVFATLSMFTMTLAGECCVKVAPPPPKKKKSIFLKD